MQVFNSKEEGATNVYGSVVLKNPHWPGWITTANVVKIIFSIKCLDLFILDMDTNRVKSVSILRAHKIYKRKEWMLRATESPTLGIPLMNFSPIQTMRRIKRKINDQLSFYNWFTV